MYMHSRHVYRYVYRHMYRQVHRQVHCHGYRHVERYAYTVVWVIRPLLYMRIIVVGIVLM